MRPLPAELIAVLRHAQSLRGEGRFAEAVAAFEAATRHADATVDAWLGLGDCLFAARFPERALAVFDEALRRSPGHPAALCGKATVWLSLNDVAAAGVFYEQALVSDAACLPARLGLIRLDVEAGRLDQAAALLAGFGTAAWRRPDVRWLSARVALGRGDAAAAAASLADLLDDPALEPSQRADILLLRGEALGEAGRPAEAFAAAVAGKAIYHDLYAERAASRESEVAKLDRLARWFATARREAWRASPLLTPAPAAGHVFLVGFPRSGTTLLEQLLAGHPDIRALEEGPTLAEHYAEFLSTDDGCARLEALSAPDAEVWSARYWTTVAAHGVDVTGRVFVDKAPAGTLSLPLVVKLFPGARVLFAVRDPRDVVLSCLRNAFQMNAMTYAFTRLDTAAACYAACMRLAAVYREVLPLEVLDVRHEALVDNLDTALDRITSFIGITPDAAMRDVAATAGSRSVRTPSARQVRAGVNRRGLGRWRDHAAALEPVLPVLAPWVEAFGYPPS